MYPRTRRTPLFSTILLILCTLFLSVCVHANTTTVVTKYYTSAITPYQLKTNLLTNTDKTKKYSFSVTSPGKRSDVTDWWITQEKVYPIKVTKKGLVYLKMISESGTGSASIYKDKECRYVIEGLSSPWLDKSITYYPHFQAKPGTYYLKIRNSVSGPSYSISFQIGQHEIKNTTLKAGEWVTGSFEHQVINEDKKEISQWHKVVIPSTGYMTVEAEVLECYGATNDYKCSVYNSKKVEYAKQSLFFGKKGKVYVPVKKGTYYLRMNGWGGAYKLRYSFKAYNPTKNISTKTAITLKPGKKQAQILFASDKDSTWTRYFKFTLTKPQKVTIKTSYTFSKLLRTYLSLYDKDNRLAGFFSADLSTGSFTSDDVLEKGTYYLKVKTEVGSENKKLMLGYYDTLWME